MLKLAKVVALLLFMFLFSASFMFYCPTVSAETLTTEVLTANYTSLVYCTGINLNTVTTSATGTDVYNGDTFAVGRKISNPIVEYPPGVGNADYNIYRAAIQFDLTAIPLGSEIIDAYIGLYVEEDKSIVDYNITIRQGLPTYPHVPLVTADYNTALYDGNLGTENTVSVSEENYWNISFTEEGINVLIDNLGADLKLFLQSSRDLTIDANIINNFEYVVFGSLNAGSEYAPKLFVTYKVGEYTYTMHGPYLETGIVYDGSINVTASYDGAAPETFVFSGSGGEARTIYFTTDYPLVSLFWNITSTYDRQRSIVVNGDNAEFYLYVPDEDEVVYQVSVGITDFAGLSNGYIQIMRNINGVNRVVMQTPLDINSGMPFWIIYYAQYDIRLVSDQGVFTWNLPADGTVIKQFTITSDMVETEYTGQNVTVAIERPDAETVTVYYMDYSLETENVTTVIKHFERGDYVTDFIQTDLGYSQNFTWTDAQHSLSYIVTVYVVSDGDVKTWQTGLGYVVEAEFFYGFFELFGEFPFPATQLFGLFIGTLFFCIGNWRDTEAFVAIGVIVTATLAVIGWITVPILGLGASFLVVVFMYLAKGKRESAYI